MGRLLALRAGQKRPDGCWQYTATAPQLLPEMAKVALRIEQDRGNYGGARCRSQSPWIVGPDGCPWAIGRKPALETYSGGPGIAKRSFLSQQTQDRILLQLGGVAATAESMSMASGRHQDRAALDSRYLEVCQSGDNRIEILVYNTLANHYGTIPSSYRGLPISGLIGPVRLESLPLTTLTGAATW